MNNWLSLLTWTPFWWDVSQLGMIGYHTHTQVHLIFLQIIAHAWKTQRPSAHKTGVQNRPLYVYFYASIHEQNLNWRSYTRKRKTLKLHSDRTAKHRSSGPKRICAPNNLKASLILTTLNTSALLSHLVGEECTRNKVNSKWRRKERATKNRNTSLYSRDLTTE
jgi:hypothetical protein